MVTVSYSFRYFQKASYLRMKMVTTA